ncbi:non-hydrolyzing UDP-N-acetylglucosamine 2-epimerase [Gemmatimonas phototrophica]|uniref:non-hydrolyzing UDP-N-acetylglucosamine 2-epimerase n=1 Tax=Gemmatimonas phototrophica TaxID=1379270 RepID=UPI0031B64B55
MTAGPPSSSYETRVSLKFGLILKILHIVGARPNFPKLAPVHKAARALGIEQIIVHTGQHYDEAMSAGFFRDLDIPAPDVNLEVGSGSHAAQTARIIERFEPVLLEHRPDWLVVYGDVNSTMATAIVAAKLGVRIAHVEAGLRSNDRTMPEEINRLVTDRLADLLLTPSTDAEATLRAEGEPANEIVFVGNVMIDTLFTSLPKAEQTGFAQKLGATGNHIVVTLHRPSNVDDAERLRTVCAELVELAKTRQVFFPAHPRTQQQLKALGIDLGGITLSDPIAYFEMLDLVRNAHAVITDSGGLQEETTALGIPCFTLRPNTERPITVVEGTNQLVHDLTTLSGLVAQAIRSVPPRRPAGWDGKAGERVAQALLDRP